MSLDAWRHFHAGEFAHAVEAGLAAGGAGINAAVKAQTVYAHYLEKSDKAKLALFEEAAGWADERRGKAPKDANAHYLYAFALGRYGQGISVAKALAQGFGGKIKDALLTALKLDAKHADAHTAYGSYQAEVINKVGGARRRHDVRREEGFSARAFREGRQAQSRIRDHPHRIRERPDPALRQGSHRRRRRRSTRKPRR